MTESVLIIEDNENIARILQYDLKQAGFSVEIVADGLTAKKRINQKEDQIYIVDWMLPKILGIELCETIRTLYPHTHIIMLSAKSDEFDKIEALQKGADDYLTKPFSSRELIARIKAYLRKKNNAAPSSTIDQLQFADIKILPDQAEVWCHDSLITLTKKEYSVLLYFLQHPNTVITRDKLLEIIWGYDYDGENRTVDVHIFKIRNKIEHLSTVHIKTVRGMGYILSEKKI